MKAIAHRANINGPSEWENTIGNVLLALNQGLDVEIDVWKLPDENFFRLGHDEPRMNESVNLDFLKNEKIWCHCKNKEAFQFLKEIPEVNAFEHGDESMVVTSRGHNWYHSRHTIPNGVNVILGDKFPPKVETFFGVCTDYPVELLRVIQQKRMMEAIDSNIDDF